MVSENHALTTLSAPVVYSLPDLDTPSSDPSVIPPGFARRHIGPGEKEILEMLGCLGFDSLESLTQAAVPKDIQTSEPLRLPPALSEPEALSALRTIAGRNQVLKSFLGQGYHGCFTPGVILRNVLENPGWYTQYTPYQAEISQGRLEALLAFQTLVCDLTAMDIANASMLDEATAAAEAMVMCRRLRPEPTRSKFFLADSAHPQTLAVVAARGHALGMEILVGPIGEFRPDESFCGALVQTPDTRGEIHDLRDLAPAVHTAGALLVVATDLLALTLLTPPGECGADVVVGNSQRFGVPLGFGGPHAGFFATRDACKRQMPGRLVGVSKDSRGKAGLRLSLGTREQHIRREKATSNICTAQALLANMAAFYAIYHGPEGLIAIAQRVHNLTRDLARALRSLGFIPAPGHYFDTLTITGPGIRADAILNLALNQGFNLRRVSETAVGIALDETATAADVQQLIQIFAATDQPAAAAPVPEPAWPDSLRRTSPFLTHPTFHRYRSETEMLRYLRRLESRDLSLTSAMIPLGSCTMKLNATCEMLPVSWPEFAAIHPFAPSDQTSGYARLFSDLETWLAEITGFAGVSLQPNAGSQGEYAGLLVIRAWHESRNQPERNVCLIPTSAHGTNPASAVMAGFEVVPVRCDEHGNIDATDLREKAAAHAQRLAALMVTYPSTHGVFETHIRLICSIIHEHGGQVYMDGANMNAQVGLCRPHEIGADVCHLNLHKTFCIPHGGGGPGVGPIAVGSHLVPFLPSHPASPSRGPSQIGPVSAAPWGSAGILPISWVYIACMGPEGLKRASQVAILNANYIAHRLQPHFPVLYRGADNLVAHECILDLRDFSSVTAEDVAKRLIDYGFHAPTLSWPVAGTLMVEPTESESKVELDRFCDAMIAIRDEIRSIEEGRIDRVNNPLKQAPHPAEVVAADLWDRPYSREQAAYPAASLREHKFWPPCSRIDNVFGDRNLVCSCVGMDAYAANP